MRFYPSEDPSTDVSDPSVKPGLPDTHNRGGGKLEQTETEAAPCIPCKSYDNGEVGPIEVVTCTPARCAL